MASTLEQKVANIDNRLDITTFVVDCAENYLNVHDPFLSDMINADDDSSSIFNLHDAMAASQLMDSKMDCCEIPAFLIAPWHAESDDRMIYPRPIPLSLDDPMTPLPWDDLTITNAAYISLEILVRLQSLLTGSSVGESTFTCLYAHSAVLADMTTRLCKDKRGFTTSLLERMEGLCLQGSSGTTAQWSVFACALALVEITESVRNIILNADIYEEEDFAANTHNIPFFTTQHTTTNKNEKSDGRLNTLDVLRLALQRFDDLPLSDDKAILQLVLGFQLDFLPICSSLARLSGYDLHRTVTAAQATVRNAVIKLQDLQSVVKRRLGEPNDAEYSPQVKSLLQQTFDSFVNRPLVGNLPIRKISFQPLDTAIPILIKITSEVDTCVCSLILHGSSLSRIQYMLDRISSSNILSRSLILLNLYFDEKLLGQYALGDLLSNNIGQKRSSENTGLISEQAGVFLNRLAKPIYDTLKLRILNRNRQRAYIEAVMLSEWMSLQSEAQLVDLNCARRSESGTRPPSTCFTRYVLAILIRLMDRYVEAGIEVGLFVNSHHDLSFAYWYRDFLLSALNQNLSLMRQTKEVEAIAAARSVHDTAVMAKTRSKKKHHQKNKIATNGKHSDEVIDPLPPSAEDTEETYELKIIALKRNMCRKTIQFLAALTQAGILKEQRFEFTTLERIFEKRFEVFGAIRQPPPLSYQNFLEGNDFSQVPSNDLLQTVSEGFQYCRASIEHILQDAVRQTIDPMYAVMPEVELRSLLKVCIGNSVYVQKLRQIVEGGGAATAKAVFDFESHSQFCIIKVTS